MFDTEKTDNAHGQAEGEWATCSTDGDGVRCEVINGRVRVYWDEGPLPVVKGETAPPGWKAICVARNRNVTCELLPITM